MMECRNLKFLAAALLLLACCAIADAQVDGLKRGQAHGFSPGMSNSNGEEIVGTRSGFEAVVTLDDANLQTLLKRGQLEVSIPQQLVNSVDAIVIKRPVHFKDAKAKDFATAQLKGQKLFVDIDQSMIERIDYQPVKLKVYESGFSSVVLNYNVRTARKKKAKLPGDPATDSPMLTVKLKSGNGIAGRIKGMQKLDLDSSLGKITVEFARTLKIVVRDNGELGVEMTNGDLISGKVSNNQFVLANRWSDETIKLSEVSSLVLHRGKRNNTANTSPQVTNLTSPATIIERQRSIYWTPTVVPYR